MAVSAKTDDVWDRICRRLRAELGEDVFTSWFGRLELDSIAGHIAQLSVPTKFLKSWIQSHYLDRMLAVIASEVAEVKGLSIVVRSSSRPAIGRPQAFQGQLGRPDGGGTTPSLPALGASSHHMNAVARAGLSIAAARLSATVPPRPTRWAARRSTSA